MDRSTALLVTRLQEAHALERGLVRTLQNHIAMTPRGTHRTGLERHLDETRTHANRVQSRLEELGGDDGLIQTAIGAVGSVIGQAVALSRAPLDLVRGPGGELKLLENTRDEIASEAFEIATYDAIEALATEIGDTTTAKLAGSIRTQEERQLERLRKAVPQLARDVVSAEVRGQSVYKASQTGAADALRTGVRKVRGAAADAREAAEDIAEEAAEQVTEAAEAVLDAAEEAAEAVEDAVEEAVDRAKGARDAAAEQAAEVAEEAKQTAKQAGREARKAPGVAAAEGEVRGVVADEDDLPIAGYDDLNAADVQSRLTKLSQRELTTVDAYERRHENRKTVLDRIEELRGQEPWSGYDEQKVAEILKLVRGGDAKLAGQVADYERRRKARATILKEADKRKGSA